VLFLALGAVPQATVPQITTPRLAGEVTLSISPTLPKHSFHFKWNEEDPEFRTVESIEVFAGDSSQPLQTLNECRMEETPLKPDDASSWFKAEDLNFDGYADIVMKVFQGATGNEANCVWLFEPNTGKFVFSRAFSDVIGNHRIDAKKKTIVTSSNGSAYTFSIQTYAVRNGEPVLILDERHEQAEGKCPYHWIRRKEKDGVMVVAEEGWIDADEKPCTP
jgi:hypothetical protein